ncbi:hypothetical protein C8Q74DRAFT_1373878 [Fomes fomentarius]|nr:hypothetical protein C8Q74DRAFT_1373878 [Fomes fomentarius]
MESNRNDELEKFTSHLQVYEGLLRDQAAEIASLKAENAYLKKQLEEKTTQGRQPVPNAAQSPPPGYYHAGLDGPPDAMDDDDRLSDPSSLFWIPCTPSRPGTPLRDEDIDEGELPLKCSAQRPESFHV